MHGGDVALIMGGTVLLLLIAAAARVVTNNTRLPLSVVLFVVGIAIAAVAPAIGLGQAVAHFQLSPGLVFYVFLPSLVFESAISLDVRELRRNLLPILTLAVPGLLISTTGIALVVALGTPLGFRTALLLGAILSATDPVAVISIFKRLGAPRRLHVLVEGESLFNDATALVVSRILATVVIGGAVSGNVALAGLGRFLWVFLGGVASGAVLGFATGYALRSVRSDSFVSITLTTILAYLSFIIAEEGLGVSGVMATVTAGLTFSGWGWMRVSREVRDYLEYFWQYVAFVANALIFLLVGLLVDPATLRGSLSTIVWAVIGMLASRILVAYGLVPSLRSISRQHAFGPRYQTVLFWGGLRGAVAVAIVLSLPEFGGNDLFLSVVIGAVLFTLLAQGLTIDPLVRLLGIDRPSLPDRFIGLDTQLQARRTAIEALPRLSNGGRFSSSILKRVRDGYADSLRPLERNLQSVSEEASGGQEQERMLYLRSLGEERGRYVELFDAGHIGERALRTLDLEVSMQIDAVRHADDIDTLHLGRFHHTPVIERLQRFIEARAPFRRLAEHRRKRRFAIDYELSWAHYQSSTRVLDRLEEEDAVFSRATMQSVRNRYRRWNETARRQLDTAADQFPEFVADAQERFGYRLLLLHERQYIGEALEAGALPDNAGEEHLSEVDRRLEKLRNREIAELGVTPERLLRGIPLLASLSDEAFGELAVQLQPRTFPAGEEIIRQGDSGSSLFLIARGVVRVTREQANGDVKEISTLLPGDFVGEMALLHAEPRTATVLAVTPMLAYELRRQDARAATERYPDLLAALRAEDRRRREENRRQHG
ncbi:MAG: cyclic nucleotide-binding domain-containing protein [Spirochaetes bacterium]|jgi:CPA1 family monovalent cation:H+ antiporter|nr:cyclic nucleotide-binding domain-containing protein [Spirochaetota bacterium]